MRSFRARFAALVLAAIACVSVAPKAKAEVAGLHLNLTPYAGFATWDGETNVQDKFLYGGRVGLGFGRYIGIEGTWGRPSPRLMTSWAASRTRPASRRRPRARTSRPPTWRPTSS